MKERLPRIVYKSLRKTIEQGVQLDPSLADIVASTMKDWAIEKGATHFTHVFYPLTAIPPKSTTVSSRPTATAA